MQSKAILIPHYLKKHTANSNISEVHIQIKKCPFNIRKEQAFLVVAVMLFNCRAICYTVDLCLSKLKSITEVRSKREAITQMEQKSMSLQVEQKPINVFK